MNRNTTGNSTFSIITGIITILSFILYIVENNYIPQSTIFLILSIVFLIFTFILILIQRSLKRKGINGIPYNFRLFLRLFNPWVWMCGLKLLYEFQIEVTKAIFQVKKQNIESPIVHKAKVISSLLLQKSNAVLKAFIGIDFSINIKLFESKKDVLKSMIKPSEGSLVVYERYPSKDEREKLVHGNINIRDNNKRYYVKNWKKEQEPNLMRTVKKPTQGGYYRSFAYDFVIGPTKHYWISNDIEKDKLKGDFFSTNESCYNYYRSLGVFLICGEDIEPQTPIELNKVVGLFIIDSQRTNIFYDKFIKKIMNIIIHNIYNYFISFEVILIDNKNGNNKIV